MSTEETTSIKKDDSANDGAENNLNNETSNEESIIFGLPKGKIAETPENNGVENFENNEDKSQEDSETEVLIRKDSDEFNQIVTAKVEEIIEGRINREIAKTRKVEADLSSVTSERDETIEKLSSLQEKYDTVANKAMKLEVAMSEGVPLEVLDLIKGNNADEIKSSLKTLKDMNMTPSKTEKTGVFETKNYESNDSISTLIENRLKNIR